MRKKWRSEDVGASEEVRTDMSSLVDMSFLLLVFFLVTSTILARERDLSMDVPVPGISPIAQGPIQLRVEADNRVVLHPGESYEEEVAAASDGYDLSALEDRLSLLISAQRALQIDVMDGASYQRFVDVLDSLKEVGWTEVTIVQR